MEYNLEYLLIQYDRQGLCILARTSDEEQIYTKMFVSTIILVPEGISLMLLKVVTFSNLFNNCHILYLKYSWIRSVKEEL